MTTATDNSDLPFNPEVFLWARSHAGLSLEEAARKIPVNSGRLSAWEAGERQPTVNQARKLAKIYARPFLEFFARETPAVPKVNLAPDFRHHRGGSAQDDSAARSAIQRWAETQRLNALDLLEMLGEASPTLPKGVYSSMREAPEIAAARARKAIHFALDEQIGIPKADRRLIPDRLRERISAAGMLALRHSELRKIGIRGICLHANPLPIIVYGNEAPGAQAFTLAHELGHAALKSSAVSGPAATGQKVRKEEDWCNRFAAAFLIPSKVLNREFPKPPQVADAIDDGKLDDLAAQFAVSPHAMLIRLISLGYVARNYYWNSKRDDFLREEKDYKQPQMRSPYYGSRYKSRFGNYYTGLVLEAWNTGAISGHNAAEFLGIKNIRHLSDIRENFSS